MNPGDISSAPLDVRLLGKGFFVGISFVSLRKGVKKRAPDEELEAMFRELEDFSLPRDLRVELANLIARRQYLYGRYSIPIPSMKGHFVPNGTLTEFLERAAELEKDVKAFVDKIVDRRAEINTRLAEFNHKYAEESPNGLLPDDPAWIKREFGKYSIRINSVTIATSDILESLPELKAKVREELMEQVNKNARELESRIKIEVGVDLKKKVAIYLRHLAEARKRVEAGKSLHGNSVKAMEQDIKRLTALTSVDPELSSLMSAVSGFTEETVLDHRSVASVGAEATEGTYVEAFENFALELSKKSAAPKFRPTATGEADHELLAALQEVTALVKDRAS